MIMVAAVIADRYQENRIKVETKISTGFIYVCIPIVCLEYVDLEVESPVSYFQNWRIKLRLSKSVRVRFARLPSISAAVACSIRRQILVDRGGRM